MRSASLRNEVSRSGSVLTVSTCERSIFGGSDVNGSVIAYHPEQPNWSSEKLQSWPAPRHSRPVRRSFPMQDQEQKGGSQMSGRVGRLAIRRGGVRGLPIALGVLWSPPASRARRRLPPRLLLPVGRRIGGARRRGRHSARQLHPSGAPCLARFAWS